MRSRAAWLLLLGALAVPAAAEEPDLFEEGAEPRHINIGPVPAGALALTADVGWLRSGLRADIGLAAGFDLVVRADAFLVRDLLSGQDSLSLGVRYTPSYGGVLRISAELGAGETFIPQLFGMDSIFVVRAEAVWALWLDELGLPYLRTTLRALSFDNFGHSGWGRDGEVGIGWERNFGRFVVGVEGFLWFRPALPDLAQWRIRVGIPI